MKSRPGSMQLNLIGDAGVDARPANADLVGRIFSDGSADIRVTGVSRTDSSRVIVERRADGKSWTVSAGLVRLIISGGRKKSAAW